MYIAIWLSYIPINFQFLQIFRTSFNINTLTEKNIYITDFPFFPISNPYPHPLTDQNLTVTKKVF